MWMKARSENRRSLTFASKMKFLTSVPLNTGSQSSHSAVATTVNFARRSHGSM